MCKWPINLLLLKNTLELTGNYRTREVYAFDIINQIGFVSLGYQTKILKSKGTLRLNATDLFFSNKVEADVAFTDYVEHFIVTRETRVCTLAFTYKFGSAQPGQKTWRWGRWYQTTCGQHVM